MNHIWVVTYHHHKWRQLYSALCSLLTICPLEGIQTRIIIIPWAYIVLSWNIWMTPCCLRDRSIVIWFTYISVNFVTKAVNYFKTYNYVLVFSPEDTDRLKSGKRRVVYFTYECGTCLQSVWLKHYIIYCIYCRKLQTKTSLNTSFSQTFIFVVKNFFFFGKSELLCVIV